ncbi:MAG: DUF1549 domain-containing protein [Planctomycetales bacterium]|nr:DUF1549 domain-containing protein [Planctomycetales bacterium]
MPHAVFCFRAALCARAVRWSGAVASFVLLAGPALHAANNLPSPKPAAKAEKIVAAKASLASEIDRLIAAERLAPLGALADDGEFLRRVMLDLHGIIPSVEEAREFLADKSPDKRERLVDELLAGPRFARHMATVLDVMWAERRGDKVVKAAEWYEWLYESLAKGRPYNEIVRDILTADDQKPELRPASKFFHDRDCEPNQITRDVSRMFFGMDMQCNQCHDHPTVDDYAIGDYYGLYALVSRTYLHTDKKTKAKVIAEKGEGEASFKSVFTGEAADRVVPRLPRGAALKEPEVKKGDEYLVKPDKGEKPVPKHSRRALLATAATDGTNPIFARNAVNRLWAHVFGRGLVHPVDFMHPENPPGYPAVLDRLTAEFQSGGYDIRPIIRTLVLTRTYQTTYLLPDATALRRGEAAKRLKTWEAEQVRLETSLKEAEAAAAKAEGVKREEVLAQARALRTLLRARERRIDEARQVAAFEKIASTDKAGAARAWELLVTRWTEQGDVPLLKPLGPEAFASSMLQATGFVTISESKALATLKKSPPKELVKLSEAERPRMESMWVDRQTFDPLKSNYARFVELYGEATGGDFSATLNQALFFGNGGVVDGWLSPKYENLAARLVAEKDAARLADEMYLAVFTRSPTDEERADVAGFLQGREKEKLDAVKEMLWALLSSNEFRFNH